MDERVLSMQGDQPGVDSAPAEPTPIRLPFGAKLIIAITLGSWIIFCFGAALEHNKIFHSRFAPTVLLALAGAPCIVLKLLSDTRDRWWPGLMEKLAAHTDAVDALAASAPWVWIGVSAAIGLFLELTVIRFHGSCFQLFAFFKNVSLLSCFLGLGIGYSIAGSRPLFTPLVLPALAVQFAFMHCLRFTPVGQFLHNPVSEQLALGLDQAGDWNHLATAYAFLIWAFAFNAACFIPLGHLASRTMLSTPRLHAYGWNLLGSLVGIVLFYLLSYLQTPPAVWVGVGALLLVLVLRRHALATAISAVACLLLLATTFAIDRYDLYSPYQLLTVNFTAHPYPNINVNHVYFQQIWNFSGNAPDQGPQAAAAAGYYAMPYVLKPHPADVLIVGAGTGNDVASAVRHGAGHIDAVEIDPTILQLGRLFHPEAPYSSPTVAVHVQDARAFIRHATEKYDLIVYGLLDSHTLLSGLSGVRLDSYIYTAEAFREARARLKPGGVLCCSFCMIRGELGRKLYLMLQNAFDGAPPVVYSTGYDGGYAFVATNGPPASSVASLPDQQPATDIFASDQYHADMSTDDWPFFYMPVRTYPLSYVLMLAMLLGVSVAFILPFRRAFGADDAHDADADSQVPATASQLRGFSLPCFLLGAGFMLLETKSITQLALFYGSTWTVVGFVIAAILLMAYFANLLLIHLQKINQTAAYAFLLASLALSLGVRSQTFAALDPALSSALMTLLVTLPLFFAGLVFSTELRRAPSTAVALGSNLIGAILGGCLEYNSMYFGYRSLSILALIIYGLALGFSRLRATQVAGK
jgi:spermidine synthase